MVFLLPGQDGQLSEAARKPVDADGTFAFSGSFLTPGQSFVLVAFYRDVPYPTTTLEVGQQSGVLLEVFEPTGRADDIVITGHRHFLAVDENGVDVAQLVHVENRGDAAYVGQGSGPERHVTELILPAGLTNLQNHTSALHRASAGRYFDTQALVPGGTQIAFSFRLPASAFDGSYVHEVIYPTQDLDFYVQPPTVQPGPPFEDLGTVHVHNRQYRHLRLRDLAPGQRVRLPVPVERPIRWMVKWVVLAGGLVAGAAAAVRVAGHSGGPPAEPFGRGAAGAPSSKTSRRPAATRRELEARRQAVLDELAGLGEADAARREELMGETVSLYRALERGR